MVIASHFGSLVSNRVWPVVCKWYGTLAVPLNDETAVSNTCIVLYCIAYKLLFIPSKIIDPVLLATTKADTSKRWLHKRLGKGTDLTGRDLMSMLAERKYDVLHVLSKVRVLLLKVLSRDYAAIQKQTTYCPWERPVWNFNHCNQKTNSVINFRLVSHLHSLLFINWHFILVWFLVPCTHLLCMLEHLDKIAFTPFPTLLTLLA